MGGGIEKLFGKQDIQLGDSTFDKNYVIQGNNEHFINDVLSYSIRDKMLRASNSLDWEIKFGEKVEKKPSKYNSVMEGILDEHLIQDSNHSPIREGHTSDLVFKCRNAHANSSTHHTVIAERCATAFEMMIQLALAIKNHSSD